MIPCPNCHAPMQEQSLRAHPPDAASLRRQLAEAQATEVIESMRTRAYDEP